MKRKRTSYSIWRILLNFWTLVTFAFVIADFIKVGALGELLGPVLLVYTAILAVYSAEKEFERWHFYFMKPHPGEIYVFLWTALILGLTIAKFWLKSDYTMDHEIIATYIVVLGVLAITRKSRNMFKEEQVRFK